MYLDSAVRLQHLLFVTTDWTSILRVLVVVIEGSLDLTVAFIPAVLIFEGTVTICDTRSKLEGSDSIVRFEYLVTLWTFVVFIQ